MGRHNPVVYKEFTIFNQGPEQFPWMIYRTEDEKFAAFAETLEQAYELIDSGAIDMCDLMCR